jgi:hypothetical protein
MIATYHPIARAPKSAPDARAVVRLVTPAGSYHHIYVDGARDARALCRNLGATLAL